MSPLADRILAGDRRALARGLRFVEERSGGHEELVDLGIARRGGAHRIGITGSPGVGKSSLLNALIGAFRRRDRQVGVLAVDPSSPLSGGALLGDRVRMGEHFLDPGVFVRSMANRGLLGGLSAAAGAALDLFSVAGFDPVFLETVGAGQSEFEVRREAETTLVVLSPGSGDQIQAMKGGIIEVGDLWVVNKADDPRAERLRAELCGALELHASIKGAEERVLLCSSLKGTGIEELADRLDERIQALEASGEREAALRRRLDHRLRAEAAALVAARLEARGERIDGAIEAILGGELGIPEAARSLIAEDES